MTMFMEATQVKKEILDREEVDLESFEHAEDQEASNSEHSEDPIRNNEETLWYLNGSLQELESGEFSNDIED